jgi:hypothetical protein
MHIVKIICILVFAVVTFSEAQEKEFSNDKDHIYKDSVGNVITKEQALALIKTGSYISVPSLNQFQQIEHVIRRPTKQDGSKYQSYSGGNTVISTSGIKKIENMKFQLGDTVSTFNVTGRDGEQWLFKDRESDIVVMVFTEGVMEWTSIKSYLQHLVSEYKNSKFVVCPLKSSVALNDLFNKQALKEASNVYVASPSVASTMNINSSIMFVTTDSNGVIQFFVPPLPSIEIAFTFLRKSLSEASKQR